jgi:hypothetical protein
VRLAAKFDIALTRKAVEGQLELLLPDQDAEVREYAVLMTSSSYPPEAINPSHEDLSLGTRRWRSDAATGPMLKTTSTN